MNPLSNLLPALEVLATNLEVLPAVGTAIQDLVRPDEEEEIDRKLNPELKVVDMLFETPARDWHRPVPPISRSQEHFFRYFLDGSRRSYFLGTAMEQNRATPIQLAQIGAAVLFRDDLGRMHTNNCETKFLLLVSKNQLSDEVWQQLEGAVIDAPHLKLEDISRDDQLNGPLSANPDLRSRGGGKTNWAMHQMEVDFANSLSNRLSNQWLIVDGSLSFEPPITAPYTIGVAKSFNKELLFQLSKSALRDKKSLFHLLCDLRTGHRTAVWSMRNGKVAFWYVRLREQGIVDYPLMGVIKVECWVASPPFLGEPLNSDLVDHISSCLVAERQVTPHGVDSRWHVHLYPIYQTEQVIKNGMVSPEIICRSIRWTVKPV